MSEETNNSVKEEKPEVKEEVVVQETQPVETTEVADANQEAPKETVEETPEQINWKKFRDERKREREEAKRLQEEAKAKEAENAQMKQMMEALLQAQSGQQMTPQETHDVTEAIAELDPNDIPTGADVQKYVNSQVEKLVEQRVNKFVEAQEAKKRQEAAAREQRELPQRLQKECPEFEKVCSEDNLDYLEYHYPEVAQAYSGMTDGMDKWKGIYGVIKKLVPNHQSHRETAMAQQNSSKPQSMSTGGMTATGDTAPAYVSSDRRQQNWERMQRVMRGG